MPHQAFPAARIAEGLCARHSEHPPELQPQGCVAPPVVGCAAAKHSRQHHPPSTLPKERTSGDTAESGFGMHDGDGSIQPLAQDQRAHRVLNSRPQTGDLQETNAVQMAHEGELVIQVQRPR